MKPVKETTIVATVHDDKPITDFEEFAREFVEGLRRELLGDDNS